MSEGKWLAPDYYTDFRCKCGECRKPCCNGWKIAVSEEEYFRIIGMECSEELHRKIESSFETPHEPSPEKYKFITSNWLGQCRMLDEDGMCALQRECGEFALSEVCRLYPRSLKQEDGILEACCSSSCEAVVELLIKVDKLNFIRIDIPEAPKMFTVVNDEETEEEKRVIRRLQNRELPLAKRIEEICFESEWTKSDVIGIKELLNRLERLKDGCGSIEPYINEARKLYYKEEGYERFCEDKRRMSEKYPDIERVFENLICNNVFYSSFPEVDSRVSERNAYKGLTLQYAILNLLVTSHIAEAGELTGDREMNDALSDVLAAIYHLVEHTPFYYNSDVLLQNPTETLGL